MEYLHYGAIVMGPKFCVVPLYLVEVQLIAEQNILGAIQRGGCFYGRFTMAHTHSGAKDFGLVARCMLL